MSNLNMHNVRPGDTVTVSYLGNPPITGEATLRDDGRLELGGVLVLSHPADGWVATSVTLLAHEPKKARIKFGDIIESPADARRFEIPSGTSFVDNAGFSIRYFDHLHDSPEEVMSRYDHQERGPFVCCFVPDNEDEK